MAALSFFSIERFHKYAKYASLTDSSGFIIQDLYKVDGRLKDIDRSERGYLLTADTMYLRMFNNSVDSIYTTVEELRISIGKSGDGELPNKVSLLRGSLRVRINSARDDILHIDSTRATRPSAYYLEGRSHMQECSKYLKEMHTIEGAKLQSRIDSEQFYEKLSSSSINYLLLVFFIVTLALFAIMIKELRERIKYQDELQAKVIDLRRSHSELEEIAYAASHDLQEPLRKIQVFSNMMLFRKNNTIDEDGKATLVRINKAANRMQALIEDLVSLTSLTKIDENATEINLNKTVSLILKDLEEKIKEKNATVNVSALPVISGYELQLHVIFKALLDNALKFTRDGVIPIISISNQVTNGAELSDLNRKLANKKFNCITISDNGIGFDDQYINKMFQIFQRLHNQESEYTGKGIGLAICQRIMANHEGYILAHGEPEIGATFKLFFPLAG